MAKRKFIRESDAQSAFRAARQRLFFDDMFKGFVDQGIAGPIISGLIADPEIANSLEALGSQGMLEDYFGLLWEQVAGVDITYRGYEHGADCHEFTVRVNGEEHEVFRYAFKSLADAARN